MAAHLRLVPNEEPRSVRLDTEKLYECLRNARRGRSVLGAVSGLSFAGAAYLGAVDASSAMYPLVVASVCSGYKASYLNGRIRYFREQLSEAVNGPAADEEVGMVARSIYEEVRREVKDQADGKAGKASASVYDFQTARQKTNDQTGETAGKAPGHDADRHDE